MKAGKPATAARLRVLRDAAGVSGAQVARRTGEHPEYVLQREREGKDVTVGVLLDYCRVLGISPSAVVENLVDEDSERVERDTERARALATLVQRSSRTGRLRMFGLSRPLGRNLQSVVNTDSFRTYQEILVEDKRKKEALKLALEAAGFAAIEVSKRLGREPNFLSRLMSSSRPLDWQTLSDVLHVVGIRESLFLEFIEGRLGDPRLHLVLLMRSAIGREVRNPDRSIRQQKHRDAPKGGTQPLEEAMASLGTRGFKSLAYWSIANGRPEEIAEAWSLLGVVERRKKEYKRSAYCHWKALSCCDETSDQAARCRLRLSYLFQYCEMFTLGEMCVRSAIEGFIGLGNAEWMGRGMIDLGRYRCFGGRFEEAVDPFMVGFKLVQSKGSRFAALQGASIALMHLGELERAKAEAKRAMEMAEGTNVFYAHYLIGECCRTSRCFDRALVHYESAKGVANGLSIDHGDRMLVSTRIVEVGIEIKDIARANREVENFEAIAKLESDNFSRAYSVRLRSIVDRERVAGVEAFVKRMERELKRRRRLIG